MLKRLALICLIIFAALAASLFFVPWNDVLEGRVVAMLESKGISDAALEIDHVSFSQAVIRNIRIGADEPIMIDHAMLNYTLSDLIGGNLDKIEISGVTISLIQDKSGWKISGLPTAQKDVHKPLSPRALYDALPFDSLNISDSFLTLEGKAVSGVIPFDLQVDKIARQALTLQTRPATLTLNGADVPAGALNASAQPTQDGNWVGDWSLVSLDLSNLTPMPTLAGGGSLALDNGQFTMNGNLDSEDNSYRTAFNVSVDIAQPTAGQITITAASFPFKEGRIATRNLVIPFTGTSPIRADLSIQQVSVDAMLQTLTGSRVSATGTLSGRVPLIISRDGGYTLGEGTLNADGAGTIRMEPSAIPGDNAQVGMVRDILQNLHYSVLSASVDSAKGREIMIKLSVEGKNPTLFEGRPVKLNINLNGDVLDFIQQNIMLITNPEKLLEQSVR